MCRAPVGVTRLFDGPRERAPLRLVLSLCVLSGVCLPSSGRAWEMGVCNAQPVLRDDVHVDLAVMPCSAPPDSHRAADLRAGVDGWNRVSGTSVRLTTHVGPATCRIETNGRNEMGYVRTDQLDGARALTRLTFNRGCALPNPLLGEPTRPRIIESDVVVADYEHDRVGPPERCDDADPNAPLRRSLVLHELGHALGFLHEDEQMAVMNTTSSAGRYCGARAIEPHPDDRVGLRENYPADGPPVRDVAAIAFHLSRPGYTRGVVDGGHYRVCPGQPLDVRWAVANLGTVDARTRVRWFVSDNDIVSQRDRPVGTSEFIDVPAGGFRTAPQRLFVPDLPRGADGESGPWWLGFVVDPDASDFELPASNNWTYTEMRLWLRDPEECP